MKKDIITIEKIGEVIELDGTKYKSCESLDFEDPCEGCAFKRVYKNGNKECTVAGRVSCICEGVDVLYKVDVPGEEVVVDFPGKPLTEKDVKDIVALMNEREFAKSSIKLLKDFRTISKVTISTEVHTKAIELTCETKNDFIDYGIRIMRERIDEMNLKIKGYGINE